MTPPLKLQKLQTSEFHCLSSQGSKELTMLTILEATCFLAFDVHALWFFFILVWFGVFYLFV